MEILVKEEIEKQLKCYPKALKAYFNTIEIETHALNRLPALYASSKIGEEQQKRLGKKRYQEQIKSAVRRAIAAIERDPLRKSTPLISEENTQYQIANNALKRLEKLLKDYQLINENEDLCWHNLTSLVRQGLNKIIHKENLQSQPFVSVSESFNRGYFQSSEDPH
ncbi:late competence development ComFB family protein [Aphanothece sacrum]|nr:late competence development ComFB family protein [Aphanothece sacrum]